MGNAIGAVGNIAGNVLGGIGARKGAKEQARSNDRAMDNQMAMYEKQLELLEPFRKAGVSGLEGLQGIAGKPIDRNALTAAYLQGPECQMMADQARYQQLASAEATGGLGSSANGNALAAITPGLVQHYLGNMQGQQQDMYNQLMGLTNVGLSGAGAQSAASAGNANAMGALYGQQGAINAGRRALPWQVAGSSLNSINNASAQDMNQFGNFAGNIMGNMMGGMF
ncbi:DNA transfer protein [Photorhabdus akhurstii]|uniref:DNA transfer protein n=1 Tax=Photorhabdus akhurstii TaxID=171438 RepID=UPI0037048FE3